MKQALGLVEIQGMSTAVVVADTMVKAANIRILEMENTKGLGYMTIKVAGDVGAVTAAVNAGCQIGAVNQKLVSWKVIPRPSDYVEHTFCNPTPPGNSPLSGKEQPVPEKEDTEGAKGKDPEAQEGAAGTETVEAESREEMAEAVSREIPADGETTAKAEIPPEADTPEQTEAPPEPDTPAKAEGEIPVEPEMTAKTEAPPEPETPEASEAGNPASPEKKAPAASKSSTAAKKGTGTRRKK